MFGRMVAIRLAVGIAVTIAVALTPVVVGGAQEVPSWSLSLTVTKSVQGEGFAAFVAAHPEFERFLTDDIFQVTATCSASTTPPEASPSPVAPSSIDLAGQGSDGAATVLLGGGKQAAIPITVEDATQVEAVQCVIAEAPLAVPAVSPLLAHVECEPVYQPSNAATFTADGQTATLDVVNECTGVVSQPVPTPPPPVEIPPTFTG